jgi:diguanylate cyclase (GGDEF)-like protein
MMQLDGSGTINPRHGKDAPPRSDAALAMRGTVESLSGSGPLFLNFPSDLEARFTREGISARRRHFWLTGRVALLLCCMFLVVDYLLAGDVFMDALRWRMLYFTPIGIFLVWLASRERWMLPGQPPPWLQESAMVLLNVLAAAVLAAILASTHEPHAHFYHIGYAVLVLGSNLVFRLRFWFALACTLAILGLHVAGVLMVGNFPSRFVIPVPSLVIALSFIALAANHAMERDERRHFLLLQRERALQHELISSKDRMQALSHEDGLTGLYNRRHFQEYLSNVWERAMYEQSIVSILMIDIDLFKRYNDRYGHQAGDECLRQIGQVLRETLNRPEDSVARYGGEEFIAVLPGLDLTEAVQVAEQVRHAIENLHVRHESSTAGKVVTASVGVATCRVTPSLTSNALVATSDTALHQAKLEGRNRIGARVLSGKA